MAMEWRKFAAVELLLEIKSSSEAMKIVFRANLSIFKDDEDLNF